MYGYQGPYGGYQSQTSYPNTFPYNTNNYYPPPPPQNQQQNYFTASKKAATVSNPPSYSSYDAAVYAAAQNYLSTNQPVVNKTSWVPAKGVAFPKTKKRFGIGAQPTESKQFYCEICKISCAGALTYKEHVEGQRHKKKEALEKGAATVTLPKNKLSYKCDLCNVTCGSQDSYNSHVRGSKHMKAAALCKKLGKPVPSDAPTIIAPGLDGSVVTVAPKIQPTTNPSSGIGTAHKGVNAVNFVQGGKLSTTEKPATTVAKQIEVEDPKIKAMMDMENIKLVGEDKVIAERDPTGKLVNYVCTLCDCKFSDPNAKEVHIKGRRHRLTYKQKVDPTLVVDQKPSAKRSREALKGRRNNDQSAKSFGLYHGPLFGPCTPDMRKYEMLDDRYSEEKHQSLFPGQEFMVNLESLVHNTEVTLKKVSEEIERKKNDGKAVENGDNKEEKKPRTLQGVMRVGILSKSLVIRGDKQVEIVVLCTPSPNEALVKQVKDIFTESATILNVEEDPTSKTCFLVSLKAWTDVKCRVMLTSPVLRESGDEMECADRVTCLEALAELRRSKWFSARCIYLSSCQKVLHLFRDLKRRDESWKEIDEYILELLVEKVLSNCPSQLKLSDAFRRVLEAIASGFLLNGVINDPCEKENINVFESLSTKSKHDVTSNAQLAVRLIGFNQLHQVLGVEKITDFKPFAADRKRGNDSAEAENGVKKEKIEEGQAAE